MFNQINKNKMKKVLSIAAVAVFALSFASCKKCTTCTYDGYPEWDYEYCGKSKNVKTVVSTYEAAGYTCS